MGIISKSWGDGQVSNSLGAVATIAANEYGVAVLLELHNTDGSSVTVDVYKNLSGTDRKLRPILIPAGGSAEFGLGDLPPGTIVKAVATTASVVNYAVTGGSLGANC